MVAFKSSTNMVDSHWHDFDRQKLTKRRNQTKLKRIKRVTQNYFMIFIDKAETLLFTWEAAGYS